MNYTSFVPEDDGFGASETYGCLTIIDGEDLRQWHDLEILEDRRCYPFYEYEVFQKDTDNHAKLTIDVRGLDEDDIYRQIAECLELNDFEMEF